MREQYNARAASHAGGPRARLDHARRSAADGLRSPVDLEEAEELAREVNIEPSMATPTAGTTCARWRTKVRARSRPCGRGRPAEADGRRPAALYLREISQNPLHGRGRGAAGQGAGSRQGRRRRLESGVEDPLTASGSGRGPRRAGGPQAADRVQPPPGRLGRPQVSRPWALVPGPGPGGQYRAPARSREV